MILMATVWKKKNTQLYIHTYVYIYACIHANIYYFKTALK